jgi:hypothetical protein
MLRSPDFKGVNVVEEHGVEIFRLVSGDPNICEGGYCALLTRKNLCLTFTPRVL